MEENPIIEEENKENEQQNDIIIDMSEVCPICFSSNLIIENRCFTCLDCGWSKCSL